MKSLSAMGIALYLLEISLLLAVTYGLLRLFKCRPRARHQVYLLALFPGTFGWAVSWIGVMFPLPVVLGLPFVVYDWLANTSPHDASWLPAPLFIVAAASKGLPMHADLAIYETGMLLIWLLVVRWTGRRPDTPHSRS